MSLYHRSAKRGNRSTPYAFRYNNSVGVRGHADPTTMGLGYSMANHEVYESPLVARYASREMSELFSERTRIRTWRRLWLALAKAEHRAGIRVAARQIT